MATTYRSLQWSEHHPAVRCKLHLTESGEWVCETDPNSSYLDPRGYGQGETVAAAIRAWRASCRRDWESWETTDR